ncbi:hypothetical protein QBC33DRAFT_304345 [Phialemonium atrogriseum]|uniref:Uncharacterized protein n=1 Tax=Phialemonium atrogriseum TaxID=1093897 RepID=A0AAJ0C4B8_9PEZI|nr:uncharacterized protein QBC33DRAFT_304345 [Phialemonium atrogriseum]KAK1769899.1 hypothetical protein QBC33DRAFT_304345 [Phialemonium atrogriseum]
MSSYYSDDESIDVHVKRYARAPSPHRPAPAPHYIQTISRDRDHVRERPHSYYQSGPVYLNPERTVVTTRSRSRERRSSPPTSQAPVAPVIIHNKIINEHSDDDYSSEESGRRHHRRRPSHSHSRSHHSPGSSSSHIDAARDQWELEKTRRELESLRVAQSRERDERRMDKQYREDAELQRAKRELDEIKRREKLEEEEKRIRKELELKKLEEERREAEEKERREKEAKEAVARYKAEEAERLVKEKRERELAEKEYQRRMQEDLIRAGVDEKDIEAILKKEKIKREDEKKKEDDRRHADQQLARPTYTRMSLRHLDVETLVYYNIEFDYDHEPGYVLIKRWVPEWEQDMLWEHTRKIRIIQKAEKVDHKVVLQIEDSKHKHKHKHKEDDQFMWVHKKTERRRSKSPGLLMYLAGGRPS